jgi:ribosomal protein L11 methyltransferase
MPLSDFIEVNLLVNPVFPGNDILITELSEIGYYMFTENEQGFLAYIDEKSYNHELLVNKLNIYKAQFEIQYIITKIKNQNWNKTWEENFNPVILNDDCIIKAPFHNIEKKYKYEIIIQPQMSFGTGHHETTALMAKEMLSRKNIFFKNAVLDMGTGTGVLAILAEKLGANYILALDIDEWAYNNALENITINNCKNIELKQGDVNLLQNKSYHIILANINLNVLLNDIHAYTMHLQKNGLIFFSGILFSDFDKLNAKAENYGLQFESKQNMNDWLVCVYKKK